MFRNISYHIRSLVRDVNTMRHGLPEPEEDPHKDAFFTLVDGVPHTYGEFNELVQLQMAQQNAPSGKPRVIRVPKLELPVFCESQNLKE